MILALLAASVPAFAADNATFVEVENNADSSVTIKLIWKIKIKHTNFNEKKQTPKVTVYDKDGNKVPSKYYTVKVSGTPRSAGKYRVTVTGKGLYTGTVKGIFKIYRIKDPFKIKVGKKTFKYNKKKAQSTWIKIVGKKSSHRVTFKTSTKKVKVNNGRIIIAKGYRGTATIKATVKASPNNYKKTTKTVKIKVK